MYYLYSDIIRASMIRQQIPDEFCSIVLALMLFIPAVSFLKLGTTHGLNDVTPKPSRSSRSSAPCRSRAHLRCKGSKPPNLKQTQWSRCCRNHDYPTKSYGVAKIPETFVSTVSNLHLRQGELRHMKGLGEMLHSFVSGNVRSIHTTMARGRKSNRES